MPNKMEFTKKKHFTELPKNNFYDSGKKSIELKVVIIIKEGIVIIK